MKTYSIEGKTSLKGVVKVSGSKNSALPILASLILLDGQSLVHNIPNLTDIVTMQRMLNALNLRTELRPGNQIFCTSPSKVKHLVPYELVTKMRASFFVAGPILGKTGFVKIPLPGGCAIGSRPVDIHLKGFEQLGATINQEHGFLDIKCNQLKGSRVIMSFPSVGATENIMMAAVLAKGETVIQNAAREPEISDLANFLTSAGAKIEGAGTENIFIQGVNGLSGVKDYRVIADRIEAGTLMVAAAITGGDCRIEDLNPEHVSALIYKLKEMNVEIEVGDTWVHVKSNQKLKACEIETSPYPGFPTDMQAQMMALMTLAEGTSVISENIFENRYMHAQELTRMGANIILKDHTAIIHGVSELSGARVQTTDLRAAAALWLAALAAQGESQVTDEGHLDRGYDRLDIKLNNLGAKVKPVN